MQSNLEKGDAIGPCDLCWLARCRVLSENYSPCVVCTLPVHAPLLHGAAPCALWRRDTAVRLPGGAAASPQGRGATLAPAGNGGLPLGGAAGSEERAAPGPGWVGGEWGALLLLGFASGVRV